MKAFSIFILVLGFISIIGIVAGFLIEDYDQRIEALMAMALYCITIMLALMIYTIKKKWHSFN